ncbi:hypothetical protein pdam_00014399 [Pocillopora damicornis]|uniref:Uncharacterized protein n=1 Tax=Pocillopora damicornis TaxID=46731 RepID=A0A3M6UFA6_POCDA|nr:hypothetical protein pdam_00014399 [Pocillopora damicornis]
MSPALKMVSVVMASVLMADVKKMPLEVLLEHSVIDTMIVKTLLERVVLGGLIDRPFENVQRQIDKQKGRLEPAINPHISVCKPPLEENMVCGPINFFKNVYIGAQVQRACGPCKAGLVCKQVGIFGVHEICVKEDDK